VSDHHEHEHKHMSRRHFLGVAAGAMAAGHILGGCGVKVVDIKVQPATDAQRAEKRKTDSPLAIVRCDSYDQNIFALLKPHLKDLDLPDLHGKTVMLKPNMIDLAPGKPITTSVAVIEAAFELVKHLGAKDIVVGEGPGHNRETERLLAESGHGPLYKRLGLKFVDLNLDDLEEVANPNGFAKIDKFYFPKTAAKADLIVSIPKLKTHHWARLTNCMKNMYGCVPGRRYGWPKNVLHYNGIDNCILDLTRLLKPGIQLVDAVVAMEGDGPLNGTAKDAKFVMLGTDPAAVDATCARIMGIDPENVPYIRGAGEAIGNIDPAHIKIFGASVDEVKTPFKPSPLFDATGKRLKTEDANAASS
jgi:uncharacterized protein (DUF362 family)